MDPLVIAPPTAGSRRRPGLGLVVCGLSRQRLDEIAQAWDRRLGPTEALLWAVQVAEAVIEPEAPGCAGERLYACVRLLRPGSPLMHHFPGSQLGARPAQAPGRPAAVVVVSASGGPGLARRVRRLARALGCPARVALELAVELGWWVLTDPATRRSRTGYDALVAYLLARLAGRPEAAS